MARARTPILAAQDGFTLIEILVAITVLLVGVLGTVTMIDGANAVTSRTKAREGGTALARTVLEIARGIPYKELNADRVLDELASRPGLSDARPGTTGHQVESRGFVFTVSPTVCAMDDPKDNLGSHSGESVVFCSDSDALGVGGAAVDRNADDYRRIAVALDWTANATKAESVRQTGIVTNPVGGLGPSVTSLTPKVSSTVNVTSSLTTSASYDLTTSAAGAEVSWSVNGSRLGQATGSGTTWTFTWDLGPTDTPAYVDCTYVVQAEAFDDKGRAGAARALTVTLNRRAPFAPPDFEGGRNLNGARVDLQWNPNRECDVKQYRVYRGTSAASISTPVTCSTIATHPTQCVDEGAPAHTTLYYQVVAVDTNAAGADREGDRSPVVEVGDESSNAGPPTAPGALAVCTGGNPDCNDIDGNPAPSGVPVLSWDASSDSDGVAFYRVYRDGGTYGDRFDVLFPVAGKPLVFIDATAGGAHDYRVSAVDGLFGESTLSGPVSWP